MSSKPIYKWKHVFMLVESQMNEDRRNTTHSEPAIRGSLVEDGVKISDKQSLDDLTSRGYGVTENGELLLTFYEALYLLDKGIMKVENSDGEVMDLQGILQCYEAVDEDAWVKYLTYRDLRSRGYVVREGFGWGVDFRVYQRGKYGEETAKYLILSIREGKPIPLKDLTRVMRQCHSLKKELILAVMNRRGEIVYYSISQLTMK